MGRHKDWEAKKVRQAGKLYLKKSIGCFLDTELTGRRVLQKSCKFLMKLHYKKNHKV